MKSMFARTRARARARVCVCVFKCACVCVCVCVVCVFARASIDNLHHSFCMGRPLKSCLFNTHTLTHTSITWPLIFQGSRKQLYSSHHRPAFFACAPLHPHTHTVCGRADTHIDARKARLDTSQVSFANNNDFCRACLYTRIDINKRGSV